MKILKKISAIILSLLVILSSMSFTLNVHMCMGEIDSIALLQESKSCEMSTQQAPCANHDLHNSQPTKKDCCEDHSFFVEGQDELAKTASFGMPDLHFVAVLYAVAAYLFAQPSIVTTFYKDYSPPLIERDIPVLVQSFLL